MSLAAAKSIILPRDYVDPAFPITAGFGAVNKDYWPNDHTGEDRGAVKDAAGKIIRPIEGAQVSAIWAGKVTLAGPDPKGIIGNRAWIEFTHDVFGLCRYGFWHLKEVFVVEGSKVRPGDVVGLVGGTGKRRDGSPVPVHVHAQFERMPSRDLLRPVRKRGLL
jgi:murein DD-endopeptidase MepM/ murein hydrolase activator NlpD